MIVTFNSRSQRKEGNKIDSDTTTTTTTTTPTTAATGTTAVLTVKHEEEGLQKNVKHINGSKDYYKFKDGRSRNGCLTCKVRKKKCSEEKPVCNDCLRFGKNCIYITDSMTEQEIKDLKKSVELQERNHKLRKRKPKLKNSTESTKLATPDHTHLSDSISPVPRKKAKRSNKIDVEANTRVEDSLDPFKAFSYNSTLQTATNPSSPGPTIPPNSPAIQNLIHPAGSLEEQEFSPLKPQPHPENTTQETKSVEEIIRENGTELEVNSPSTFLTFLRDVNSLHNHNHHHQVGFLEDSGHNHVRGGHEIETDNDEDKIQTLDVDLDNPELREILTSPDFNGALESFENSSHPINGSNISYVDLISSLNLFLHHPQIPPSPTYIPELIDPTSSYLYNYYADVLSRKISIAPISQNESNSYQKVFLPLAHRDKGVLYAILAWSGFHLGGHWSEEGVKYLEYALDHLNKSMFDRPHHDRQMIVNMLATLMILCAAEICKGDVKNWSVYLHWGWKLLSNNGGILSFNKLKEEHWLISNFAYHDLLASSSSERGTYFPSEEYDFIFRDDDGFSLGNLNPLLGISKNLYRIIGDISTLLYESKKQLDIFYSREFTGTPPGVVEKLNNEDADGNVDDDDDCESQLSDHGKASQILLSVISKVKNLEKQIDESKPAAKDLVGLTDQELELQLTLFEAFQLSAKLFLRQSIMKCNPSMLESQVLNNDLIKCLDVLVGTSVQASLVFPIFISGIHCVSRHDQELMRHRINKFIKLYGLWNVCRVSFVLQKIWKDNPDGSKVVDWHNLLKELGWDINFA